MKNPAYSHPTMLMEGATATHELFMAYVEAGFAREEALQLVIAMLSGQMPGREK